MSQTLFINSNKIDVNFEKKNSDDYHRGNNKEKNIDNVKNEYDFGEKLNNYIRNRNSEKEENIHKKSTYENEKDIENEKEIKIINQRSNGQKDQTDLTEQLKLKTENEDIRKKNIGELDLNPYLKGDGYKEDNVKNENYAGTIKKDHSEKGREGESIKNLLSNRSSQSQSLENKLLDNQNINYLADQNTQNGKKLLVNDISEYKDSGNRKHVEVHNRNPLKNNLPINDHLQSDRHEENNVKDKKFAGTIKKDHSEKGKESESVKHLLSNSSSKSPNLENKLMDNKIIHNLANQNTQNGKKILLNNISGNKQGDHGKLIEDPNKDVIKNNLPTNDHLQVDRNKENNVKEKKFAGTIKKDQSEKAKEGESVKNLLSNRSRQSQNLENKLINNQNTNYLVSKNNQNGKNLLVNDISGYKQGDPGKPMEEPNNNVIKNSLPTNDHIQNGRHEDNNTKNEKFAGTIKKDQSEKAKEGESVKNLLSNKSIQSQNIENKLMANQNINNLANQNTQNGKKILANDISDYKQGDHRKPIEGPNKDVIKNSLPTNDHLQSDRHKENNVKDKKFAGTIKKDQSEKAKEDESVKNLSSNRSSKSQNIENKLMEKDNSKFLNYNGKFNDQIRNSSDIVLGDKSKKIDEGNDKSFGIRWHEDKNDSLIKNNNSKYSDNPMNGNKQNFNNLADQNTQNDKKLLANDNSDSTQNDNGKPIEDNRNTIKNISTTKIETTFGKSNNFGVVLGGRTDNLDAIETLTSRNESNISNVLPNRSMEKIIKNILYSVKNNKAELKIDLRPDILGNMRVQIVSSNKKVKVSIATETQYVKEVIENNLSRLKAEFINNKLDIDKLDVFVNNNFLNDSEYKNEPNSREIKFNEDETNKDLSKISKINKVDESGLEHSALDSIINYYV